MAGRSSHFAAPLLLAVVTGLIVYVSLYPFRFVARRPHAARGAALAQLGARRPQRHAQQRAAVCAIRLLRRAAGRAALGTRGGHRRGHAARRRGSRSAWSCCRPRWRSRVSSLRDLSLNARGLAARHGDRHRLSRARQPRHAAGHATQPFRVRRDVDPGAVAARAAVAADARSGAAPAEARRAAAAHAAHRVDGARGILRRLARRRAGRVRPRRAPARDGRRS